MLWQKKLMHFKSYITTIKLWTLQGKHYYLCQGCCKFVLVPEAFRYMGLDARKHVFGICEQQRRKPACASAQSDQRLCYSLIGKYQISTYYERNFNFLASLCSWAGWFESRFDGNPEDRFCCVELWSSTWDNGSYHTCINHTLTKLTQLPSWGKSLFY